MSDRINLGRAFGVAVAVATLAVAVTQISGMWQTVRAYAALPPQSPTTLELAPAATHGVSTTALVLAEQTIPANAVYTVVVGEIPPLNGIEPAISPIFQYWLLPRRYTPNRADADWIVAYHESSELLGVPIEREIGLGPDANVVEVRR